MAEETRRDVELTIEYPDYDEYDVVEETIEATITIDGDDWTLAADGLEDEGEQTFRVVEDLDKINVAPVGKYGPSVTQTADYEPGTGRVEPQYLKYDDKYVEAIVGDAVEDTLGQLVSEARDEFQSERGIGTVDELDVDVPDIELEVREGNPMHPSSKTGQTMAPREELVVEPVDDTDTMDRWQDAIVETTNRYQVWAGTSTKGTDELLAPEDYEAGDTLTLAEYLDAWYTVDPRAVADAVPSPEDVAEAEAEREREEQIADLRSEHPELHGVGIENPDAFDDAEQAGERVKIGLRTTDCNDSSKECSLDRITLYATPDGDVVSERVHTY